MGEARAHSGRLLILPALAAFREPGRNGPSRVVLTRKFIDGVIRLADGFGGRCAVVMEPRDAPTDELDQVAVAPGELPFELHVESFRGESLARHIASSAVVLSTLSSRLNGVGRQCRELSVPCVFVSENTLRTRLQQVRATAANPVVRLRRMFWHWSQERRQRAAIRSAAGIQCNGTPTFEAYRPINPNPLLFFDSRITENMLPDEEALEARLASMERGRPLRLAFSGRLIRIKGVAELPVVASELKRLGVPFEMTIYGGGEQEARLRDDIRRRGLEQEVRLGGRLEFRSELVPTLQREVDLFVCPHLQGDPSCTYLETLACGVPIAGYANEAFAGLLRQGAVGWSVPMRRWGDLARRIAELHSDRSALAKGSRTALDFAQRHCFERTFRVRSEHLYRCSLSELSRDSALSSEYAQIR